MKSHYVNTAPSWYAYIERMERNLLVIINAAGGKTIARRVRRIVASVLAHAGLRHEIFVPTSARRARRLAEGAAERGFTEIVCAGGDGTISLVARSTQANPLPLSLVPRGTGNVLAKYLDIPLRLRPALGLIVDEAPPVPLDAIERDNTLSVLNLSIGLSSLTMSDVDTRMKRVFGTATYVVGVLLYLIRRNPARFRIVADGREYRYRGREVLLANAGFRRTAIETFFADSRPDDGVIECSVFFAAGLRGAFAMIADVLAGRPTRSHRYMVRILVRESISIESDPLLPIQADGDPVGFGATRAGVRRRALAVRAPAGLAYSGSRQL